MNDMAANTLETHVK